MKEEEKQRKFHEALVKMMYPPAPTSSLLRHEDEDEGEEHDTFLDIAEEELENEGLYSSSGAEGANGKLTRAQRKRLRKRKLKESASNRRMIIGPLLPGSSDDVPERVRQNAATNASEEPPAPCSGSKRNKLRKRRMSKNQGSSMIEKTN